MSEITIIVPVLNRPWRAAAIADSAWRAATRPTDVLFVCTPGDNDEIVACEATGARVVVTDWKGGQGDYARKINLGAALTDTPWVFTGADDLTFHDGWDKLALDVATERTGVIGTADRCNVRTRKAAHSTHSLVARWYIDTEGTIDARPAIYHEGYWHNFCDDEMIDTAIARNAYARSRAVVEHHHPMNKTAPDDATYRLGMEHWHEDRQLFFRRKRGWNVRRPRRIR